MLSAVERFVAASPDAPPNACQAPAKKGPTMESLMVRNPLAHPMLKPSNPDDMITVARYGRIYKRKRCSTTVEKSQFVCAPGYRYCSVCDGPQPLSAFYTRVKRFVCKRHHRQRVGRYMAAYKKEVDGLDYFIMQKWKHLWGLCPLLGYEHPEFAKRDMLDLLLKLEIPLQLDPHFVPIDPTLPMRPRNVAIVSKQNFKLLAHLYRITNSRAMFVMFVQACNLVPVHADVGVPWDPLHDKGYQRKELDVGALLAAEKELPRELPAVDTMEAILQASARRASASQGPQAGREPVQAWS